MQTHLSLAYSWSTFYQRSPLQTIRTFTVTDASTLIFSLLLSRQTAMNTTTDQALTGLNSFPAGQTTENLAAGPQTPYSSTALVDPRMPLRCSRCDRVIQLADMQPRRFEYYRCHGCDHFQLCMRCAADNLYCRDIKDSHSWAKYTATSLGLETQVGPNITPSEARAWLSESQQNAQYPVVGTTAAQQLHGPLSHYFNEDRSEGFIDWYDPRKRFIYTGAVLHIREQDKPAVACWGMLYREHHPTWNWAWDWAHPDLHNGTWGAYEEGYNTDGVLHPQTIERAQLLAIVGALQFRSWAEENRGAWRQIVITFDDNSVLTPKVMDHLSERECADWRQVSQNDASDEQHLAETGKQVGNSDLWQVLVEEVRKLHAKGVRVCLLGIGSHQKRIHKKGAPEAEAGAPHVLTASDWEPWIDACEL